jgi:predicted amidohydrolase
MNNTPASLLKKITLKRAALAEAKAAHAEAVRTASASARSLGYSDPVDNAIDKARADADSRAVFDAHRLVKRRAYALAGLEDALDRAHVMAAAAHRAADVALHDADLDATAEDRAARNA